ncbi:MAG: hypothetical protein Q4G64_02170 [bacterium]|nr:hypothetical protein [bacterium]
MSTPVNTSASEETTPARTTAQKRELRGRIVAVAAFIWAALGAFSAIQLLTSGRAEAITSYGWWQLGLAGIGLLGAVFLFMRPFRHGIGWGLLMAWAILMIPIISSSRANVAFNDQFWNGLSFWLTERVVIGNELVMYARTGLNVMGLIWVVLLNTTVVEQPLKRVAPPTDVMLPGPSRKGTEEAETPEVESAAAGHTL